MSFCCILIRNAELQISRTGFGSKSKRNRPAPMFFISRSGWDVQKCHPKHLLVFATSVKYSAVFLSTKQLQTYSSNIANDVATGCFLITKGFFCFKLTSDKPVSSFIVTDGSCTEEMKTMHWNNIKHCCFSVGWEISKATEIFQLFFYHIAKPLKTDENKVVATLLVLLYKAFFKFKESV